MLLSISIVIVVLVWMLSGLGKDITTEGLGVVAGSQAENRLVQVRIQEFAARQIQREVVISAQTEPDREIDIKAEAEGSVREVFADRGAAIATGARIITLDPRDRPVRLSEAQSLVKQRELEFTALSNLKSRNFTTEVQIAEARARLDAALASQKQIEQEIQYTTISAPFSGILFDRIVEVGDYVRVGDVVARLVDLDPLVISGVVNEREVSELAVGSKGKATLIDGTAVEGQIRYLAPVADASTRSFKLEVAVDNPGNTLRAGQTAELTVSANAVVAHTLSAGLLSLADDGTIGVKVVDNQDLVKFYPVSIVGSSDAGMHVTGLPDYIRLITVGQGFVTEGQRVEPILVSSPESASSYERAD